MARNLIDRGASFGPIANTSRLTDRQQQRLRSMIAARGERRFALEVGITPPTLWKLSSGARVRSDVVAKMIALLDGS